MPWLLLLSIAAAATGGVLQALAQSNLGFVSIDCGLPGQAGYVDNITTLSYSTDAGFIDDYAGSNHNISVQYITPSMPKISYNVRSFLNGARNCYTVGSLESGLKYLIRANFLYGNYDGLNKMPIFDLYVGVNFWTTVNISSSDTEDYEEVIVVVPDDFVQVCLVNTGVGTPFISALELRPLKNTLYPLANATQGLVLLQRINFGPSYTSASIRYPDDPHDRIWLPLDDPTDWAEISTAMSVSNDYDLFEAPQAVMQTAITPRNVSMNIEFPMDLSSEPTLGYVTIMHFSELQLLSSNDLRQYYININGELYLSEAYSPTYLSNDYVYSVEPSQYGQYVVSLNATSNSTLPPIINALELFSAISTVVVGTDSQDVSSMMAITEKYQVHKNWMGDPCVPKTLQWNGLTCGYAVAKLAPIILAVNMSFSGLNGTISSSFANLENVQYLNLSNNNLTGLIPDALSQLASLTLLDLSSNNLHGSIPSGLLKRIQDGNLDLRYGNNPDLCTDSNSCQPAKRKSNRAIIIVAVLVVVVLLVGVLLFYLLKRNKQGSIPNPPKLENKVKGATSRNDGYADNSLRLENRRFTYKELEMITTNFQQVLGQGAFGYVYHGFLEDGIQVAVKLRSHSSNQGVKEFLVEAQILTRIHHKNLVTMIGYCKDGEYMALVYEYMPEGNLQEHIAGKYRNGRSLSWRQRLRIALESAQGLEYLHKGCNPPLIHRDVKATNILLNTRLEAKITDFGLSKAFSVNNDAHVSTNTLVGTPGYVDPEYQATMQPSTKSDVYSFGVVLLELITGKLAILREPKPMSVIRWAQQRLARGDIEGVVDMRMEGDYDVNSAWNAADIALKCTEQASRQRPTMTDVVVQLQECLDLEENRIGVDINDELYTGSSTSVDPYLGNRSYSTYQSDDVFKSNTAFEMERNFKRAATMEDGPAAR